MVCFSMGKLSVHLSFHGLFCHGFFCLFICSFEFPWFFHGIICSSICLFQLPWFVFPWLHWFTHLFILAFMVNFTIGSSVHISVHLLAYFLSICSFTFILIFITPANSRSKAYHINSITRHKGVAFYKWVILGIKRNKSAIVKILLINSMKMNGYSFSFLYFLSF